MSRWSTNSAMARRAPRASATPDEVSPGRATSRRASWARLPTSSGADHRMAAVPEAVIPPTSRRPPSNVRRGGRGARRPATKAPLG
eukprot:937151-Alexandrium_andersonii.AAC.1